MNAASNIIGRIMIAILWQFDVHKGREKEFERFYGADGDWTLVNRHSRSYLGSSFLRDQTQASRYVLIEYWSEMLVYEEHKSFNDERLRDLEVHRDELISSVEPLGVFTALDVPDRFGPTWSRRS
jgi:quinol monooxygenase YgiN